MTREHFEQYLGKRVKITLSDGDVIAGKLYKTDDDRFKDRVELYLFKRYYVLLDDLFNDVCSCLFRVSHVKKIEVIGDE